MDYTTLFLMLLTASIIGIIGHVLQRRKDAALIRSLEGQRSDAYDEMAQQEWCCERVPELEARIRELEQTL